MLINAQEALQYSTVEYPEALTHLQTSVIVGYCCSVYLRTDTGPKRLFIKKSIV